MRREAVLNLRLGPGFLPKQAPIISILRVSSLTVPFPLDQVYVGNGDLTQRIHPTPWLNPFAPTSSSASQARVLFKEYAQDRADAADWLAPLFGKTIVSEVAVGLTR